MDRALKTLIIDDEPGAAADLAQLVRALPDVTLLAVVEGSEKAIASIEELAPDE
ncbi:MAG TPA: hypothetical protein PKG48_02350 [Bacteroidales bacterium]|nr:hypothetical protein [Bacteroidales bacterium]HPS61648.1 hypothetical protein [Bacteroidales bacterium]